MEVILWLADDPNNLPIDPTFKTVGDLEATLRDRLLSQDDLLRSLALSEQIFYTDPDLPDDRDRAIQYSMGYALGAAKLKSKHPSLAYYRLTQLIRDLNKFPNIVSSTEYLRVQAEWIASAAYSSDFSSVYENRLRMETLLTMHIDRLTGSIPLQSDELVLDDDLIVEYRAHILPFIVFLSQFYFYIGAYADANVLIQKGIRIATLMNAAHHKFNLTLLRLISLIDKGDAGTKNSEDVLKVAKIGADTLSAVFLSRKNAFSAQGVQDQMTIVELYRDIRKSSTASVEEMAKMIQKWNVLNESEYIDQDDRARLAHIEVLLFIYYRSLQQEDEKLSYAREHAPHEFGIILSFRQKLADSGFELDEYRKKSNARLFLTSFIDLFEHRVRESIGSGKKMKDSQVESIMSSMIEIYRLLVGIGDFDRNLELLLKMPFYTQYIQAAKLFLVHIKEGIDLRDAEVLDHIGVISQEREREAQINHSRFISHIVEKWKRIGRITLSKVSEDQASEQESRVIFEGEIRDINTTQVFYCSFNEVKYKFTLTLDEVPYSGSALSLLRANLANLIAYEEKKIVEAQMGQTMKVLQHDLRNLVDNLGPATQIIQMHQRNAQEQVAQIIAIPGNSQAAIDGLRALSAGPLSGIGRMVEAIIAQIGGVDSFGARMIEEVKGVFGYSAQNIERKSLNFRTLIESISRGESSEEILINIESVQNCSVLVNDGMLRGLIGNIIQNAKRYNNPGMAQAVLDISASDQGDSVVMTFKDYGRGMTDKAMTTFKSASGNSVLDYGDDPSARALNSKRVGAVGVMNTVRAHGGTLDITSKVGVYTEFKFTFPKNF